MHLSTYPMTINLSSANFVKRDLIYPNIFLAMKKHMYQRSSVPLRIVMRHSPGRNRLRLILNGFITKMNRNVIFALSVLLEKTAYLCMLIDTMVIRLSIGFHVLIRVAFRVLRIVIS